MTDVEKREFLLKLDQLVESSHRLRERVEAHRQVSEESERASEAFFKKFVDERRQRQEGGGERPPAGN